VLDDAPEEPTAELSAPPARAGRGFDRFVVSEVALVGVYAVVAIGLHARSTFLRTTFGSFSDWTDYRLVTRSSVWSSGFWTGVKPAGYPLLVKVLGEGSALHWSGVLLSVVAWSALALAVALVLRNRWLALSAVALILGLSLSERIQVWNDLAGSETHSLSLLVLALAAGLVLTAAPVASSGAYRRLRIVAWVVLAVSVTWWAVTRDSNTYVVMLAVVVVAAFAVGSRSHALAVAGAVALLVSVGCLVASDVGDRWVVPYDNIVFNRVLTDRELAAAWRDAGMPDSPALRSHIGEVAFHGDPALFRSPRLAAFRRWVDDHGRRTYLEELITRPSLGIAGPLDDLDELLTSPVEVWGHIGGRSYRGSPVDPVVDALFLPDPVPLAIWSVVVVIAGVWLLVASRRSPTRRVVWLSVAVLVLAVPHLWLVWVGDAHNIARHAVTASVQLRVTGWLVLVLALDELLSPRRRRAAPADAR
jgi:hypothetical protein